MLFVTAFYLPESAEPHRSIEAYLDRGRFLVAAGVPLRVHTSPDLAETLQKSWEGLPTDHVELRTDVLSPIGS